MAHLPSQPLVDEHTPLLELLRNHEFLEYGLSVDFPASGLYRDVPQNFSPIYQGAVGVFNQVTPRDGRAVNDGHILPVPCSPSIPSLSVNNTPQYYDLAPMRAHVNLPPMFIGERSLIIPSASNPSIAGVSPLSYRHAPSSSALGGSQLSSPPGNGQGVGQDVGARLPHIKQRPTFPGTEYECRWGSCKETLVLNLMSGEHPLDARERFQDAIENHIENHIWIYACGKEAKRRWNCRWGDCEETLGCKRALIRHIGGHSGFRVLCDECGQSYSRFDIFRRHQSRCGGRIC